MFGMQKTGLVFAVCFAVLLACLASPGSSARQNPDLHVPDVFTDSKGMTYNLHDIIEADLNGDGQKEQVVLYKGRGTSSLLSYQVWHFHKGSWQLWHEQEALYQGIVEVRDGSLLERVPLYRKDDANALPGAFLERTYTFPGGVPTLVDEKEELVLHPRSTGDWENPPRAEIEEMIREAALLHGIPPVIVKAVAYTESNLRQFHNGEPLQSFDGVSWGIMQVTPHSHPQYDLEKLKYDIRYNIQAGTEILLEKWGYAFAGTPLIPKIGDNDPRVLENYYFTIWAYNGWSSVNNPNTTTTEVYQEKVIRHALQQFGQEITPIPPEELPEEGRPSPATSYDTPLPLHSGEYRTHHPGNTLISMSNNLALRNDSWTRLYPNIPYGKGLEVLAGPVLYNGYIRYQIETIEEDGETSRTGWVAMNWAFPMPSADINGDGLVDIYDLALIAAGVGKQADTQKRKKLDLNYDGEIDEYDLLLAMRGYHQELDASLPGNIPLPYRVERRQVNSGEEFTVDIEAGYLEDLYAYELQIAYEPEAVQLLSVEDLDPLEEDEGFAKTILNREASGTLQFAKTKLSADDGIAAGDLGFLRLHFKALVDLDTEEEPLLSNSTARFSDSIGIPIYPALLGDVSGSGTVDVGDAILVLRSIVGLVDLTERQLWAANVTGNTTPNGDHLVDVGDAILILRYIVGLIEDFSALTN